jgi:hypothetical protein
MSTNHLQQDLLRQLTRAGFEGADPPDGLRITLPSDGSVEGRLNVLEHLVIALGNELITVAGKV